MVSPRSAGLEGPSLFYFPISAVNGGRSGRVFTGGSPSLAPGGSQAVSGCCWGSDRSPGVRCAQVRRAGLLCGSSYESGLRDGWRVHTLTPLLTRLPPGRLVVSLYTPFPKGCNGGRNRVNVFKT